MHDLNTFVRCTTWTYQRWMGPLDWADSLGHGHISFKIHLSKPAWRIKLFQTLCRMQRAGCIGADEADTEGFNSGRSRLGSGLSLFPCHRVSVRNQAQICQNLWWNPKRPTGLEPFLGSSGCLKKTQRNKNFFLLLVCFTRYTKLIRTVLHSTIVSQD